MRATMAAELRLFGTNGDLGVIDTALVTKAPNQIKRKNSQQEVVFAPNLYKKAPESERRNFLRREREMGMTHENMRKNPSTSLYSRDPIDYMFGEQKGEVITSKMNRGALPRCMK